MSEIPVVILCGGMGTRLREETAFIPKPMVTVGGRPILWHIMKYYSSFGFTRFILCLGYKGELIKEYFLNYKILASSFTLDLASGEKPAIFSAESAEPWNISFVDTGIQAMTGTRVKRIAPYVSSTFMLTYGDGLSDVDLHALLQFHRDRGALVTVTGIHPPSRFGLLTLDGPRVIRFDEKGYARNDYINGGFLVCEPGIFEYLDDDDGCILEREPLERISRDGKMVAYRHESYWQCMDTVRDREVLEEAWARNAPWKRW